MKVTRRGRRPVLPRTEAASLRVLERERRKRARKELLNFYAWQHRESKMERKEWPGRAAAFRPQAPALTPGVLGPASEVGTLGSSTAAYLRPGSLGTTVPKGFGGTGPSSGRRQHSVPLSASHWHSLFPDCQPCPLSAPW